MKVDVTFSHHMGELEEKNLTQRVDTTCMTTEDLRQLVRSHFNLSSQVKLWLLDEEQGAGGAAASRLDVGPNEPIIDLIKGDCSIRVEQVSHPTASNNPFKSLKNGCQYAMTQLGLVLAAPFPGEVVATASTTQFGLEGGQSACTSICLFAASKLLSQFQSEMMGLLSTHTLDSFLLGGIALHTNGGDLGHTSVDDLWGTDRYRTILRSLSRCDPPFTGNIDREKDWHKALVASVSYAEERPSVAVIITKPPETVLVVCTDVSKSGPWLFFDSHGNEADVPMAAFVRKMADIPSVTSALRQKFPVVNGLENDGSLLLQQLNTFEAHAIVYNPFAVSGATTSTAVTESNKRDCTNGVVKSQVATSSPEAATGSIEQQSKKETQPLLIDEDLVRDPTLGELFVDPVICDKGHTHERSVIEAHFKARQEMKKSEQTAQAEGANSDDDCVGARNYDPTCPYTGEPISDILIPNDHCNRLLPFLLESGAIQLDDGELEKWRAKREDVERLKKQKREDSKVDDQDETESPAAATQNGTKSAPMMPSARTVHIAGPLLDEDELNLGLAVSLCPMNWSNPNVTSAAVAPSLFRCHNACCRRHLEENGETMSCSRCARIHCVACVLFHVADASSNARNVRFRICPDCVFQICDVLAGNAASDSPEAERVRQIDSLMVQFFTQTQQRHEANQFRLKHFEMHRDFCLFRDDIEKKITSLEQTKESVQQTVRRAEEKAQIARDSGDDADYISKSVQLEELNATILSLQSQYESTDWTDEESVRRASGVEQEYNDTTDKALQLSSELYVSTTATAKRGTMSVGCKATEITNLQRRIAELEKQQIDLLQKGPADEHDINFAIQATRIADELASLSVDLAKRRREKTQKEQESAKKASSSNKTVTRMVTRLFRGNNSNGKSMRKMPPPSAGQSDARVRKMPPPPSVEQSDAPSAKMCPSALEFSDRVLTEDTVDHASSEFRAIGIFSLEEMPELPLDLRYPSTRMKNEVSKTRTQLGLAEIESGRQLDKRYEGYRNNLNASVERLEDEIVALRRQATSAEATADDEERLRRERLERRREAARERLRQEAERRREEQRLQNERRQQEQTREFLKGQDLRACGKCGFGPFQNLNCYDMNAHNRQISYMDKNGRRQSRKYNACPECGWHDGDWKNWPKFREANKVDP